MLFAFNFFPLFAAQLGSGRVQITPLLVIGTLLVLLGLLCDAIIISRFLPTYQFRVSYKPWDLVDLANAVGILGAIFLFSTGIYHLIATLRRQDIITLAPLILSIEFFVRLAVFGGFLAFFHRRKVSPRQALGLDTIKPSTAVGWGTTFGLAILPPVGVILFASNAFCRLLRIDTSEQPIVDFFLKTDSYPFMALLTVFAVVVAPICEELFFRGFAYPALKQRLGVWRSLLLVSAVFAVSHLHGPSLIPLFVLAVGLGMAYELTGSLLAPITMHAVFNAIMILQVFHARGLG